MDGLYFDERVALAASPLLHLARTPLEILSILGHWNWNDLVRSLL